MARKSADLRETLGSGGDGSGGRPHVRVTLDRRRVCTRGTSDPLDRGRLHQERLAAAENLDLHALVHQRGALERGSGVRWRGGRQALDEGGPLGVERVQLAEGAVADQLELALDAPGERLIRLGCAHFELIVAKASRSWPSSVLTCSRAAGFFSNRAWRSWRRQNT